MIKLKVWDESGRPIFKSKKCKKKALEELEEFLEFK